ncbi:MAG: PIN domain-containing protein [Vicinamibacterales bacterium]
MTRLLFDVNVVLDVLLDRAPFADASSAAWEAVERGRADGVLSAHAVTTIHYLNSRAVGARAARRTTDALLDVFGVAPVDETVLRSALGLGWPDFEDAVTAAAARRARCHAIVTRDPKGFRRSPVRIVTPDEAVAWLASS